jgi:hypothetical protein
MPIAVTCPACACGYRVPDTAAGRAIKCKKCGARVPVAAETNGSPAVAEGAPSPPKKKQGGAAKILLIVGGILAASCLLCTGVGAVGSWWFFNRTTTTVINDPFKDAPKGAIVIKDGKDALKDAFKDAFKDFSKGFK